MPVEIIRRHRAKDFPIRKFKALALRILQITGHEDFELTIGLIGDAEMRRLNAKFRNKDYPTDVLSFPVEQNLPGAMHLLGDVIISLDKARQQAKEQRRSLREEIVTLLIHGVVHLLGYDHERSVKDARIMGRLEKKIYGALCDPGKLPL
jgi:probable rRNA maturation factor